MPKKDDKIRQALLDRRAELMQSSAEHEDERKPVELDQQSVGRLSRMDALQQQAMAAETQRRRSLDLQRIGAALRRIGEGEYCYCLTCGEDMVRARLELDPAATQCVACAERTASDT